MRHRSFAQQSVEAWLAFISQVLQLACYCSGQILCEFLGFLLLRCFFSPHVNSKFFCSHSSWASSNSLTSVPVLWISDLVIYLTPFFLFSLKQHLSLQALEWDGWSFTSRKGKREAAYYFCCYFRHVRNESCSPICCKAIVFP